MAFSLPDQRLCGSSLRQQAKGHVCRTLHRRRVWERSSGKSDEMLHETKPGPGVLVSVKDLREKLTWCKATLLTNQAASADGSTRLLNVSIEDDVDMLYGRKVQSIPEGSKWIDSYTLPGQCVALRIKGSESSTDDEQTILKSMFCVASTPYQSRQNSAYLSSSLIEVLVAPGEDSSENAQLAQLAPGAELQVSPVIGRGFTALFNSFVSLPMVMEEGRPLLLLANGVQGMAAIRSAANWPPLQAYASAHPVALYYFTHSAVSAALVAEWDRWRDAGVQFHPVYTNGDGSPSGLDAVTSTLFERSPGLEGAVGNRVGDCAVLLAGFAGEEASVMFRMLTQRGVAGERVLFNVFF